MDLTKRDPKLLDLYERIVTRPNSSAEIDGVDLVTLDDDVLGVSSHYIMNSRPLTDEHRAMLQLRLGELDGVTPSFTEPLVAEHFRHVRAMAARLLESR